MSFATQAHIDDLKAVGREVIAAVLQLVASEYAGELAPYVRDVLIGRELAMAMFLAARGDEAGNRVGLIEGFANAVGEWLGQQPESVAAAIRAALARGLSDGEANAREAFITAGHA